MDDPTHGDHRGRTRRMVRGWRSLRWQVPDKGEAHRFVLASLSLLLLSVPAFFWAWWLRRGPTWSVHDAQLQLAGSHSAACDVIDGQPDDRCGASADQVDLYISAINGSWFFLIGTSLALAGILGLGAHYLFGRRARRAVGICLIGVVLEAAADVAENMLLLSGLRQFDTEPDAAFAWAAAFATVKFALFAPLSVLATVVLIVLVARRITRPSRTKGAEAGPVVVSAHALENRSGTSPAPDIIEPPAVAGTSPAASLLSAVDTAADDVAQEMYEASEPSPDRAAQSPEATRTRWLNASRVPPGRKPAGVGICASGGGIRSACITLGALQALRDEGILPKSRYLVAVSGGAYAAGAFQLALAPRTADTPPAVLDPDPRDVLAPGTPEEDHIRRHGRYIADGLREWIVALAVLTRGVVTSLLLLALTVIAAGLALNVFYRLAPVVDVTVLLPRFDPQNGAVRAATDEFPNAPDFPTPPSYVWLVLLGGLGVAALILIGVMIRLAYSIRPARRWLRAFQVTVAVLAIIAAYAVLLPAVFWAMARLTWTVPEAASQSARSATSLLATLTTAVTWLGALASVLWRRVERIRTSGTKSGGLRGLFGPKDDVIEQQVATSLPQRIIVWVVLAALAFVFLFVLSWTTVSAQRWNGWPWTIVPAALALAVVLLDQTWLGLHPFYRQRLASAFAVRRARMPDQATGALAYDFAEPTTLSVYGRPLRSDDDPQGSFPQVIFAGAAALSGQSRTPPGRRAVSFTFSHDYVGGPDVGYVRTAYLENAHTSKPAIRRDVTVQAAMAISGAAFASTMGRQSKPIERLLALSNVRLGTWLPNPAFLATLARWGDEWTTPRLPRIRRLIYLLREIAGAYPAEGPMLLCTDGGHYENLGLVELLRHRCRVIYAIDASGDSPPFATTLAEAITLAYEELGVRIVLDPDEYLALVPGRGKGLEPQEALARLNPRLSERAVITGKIIYPRDIDFNDGLPPSREGTLVLAKAVLTADMPYEVLTFALKEPTFPRQSTADQFFDHEQFDAYRALGHVLGSLAARRVELVRPTVPNVRRKQDQQAPDVRAPRS